MPSANPQTDHSATLVEILSQPVTWQKSLQELSRGALVETVPTRPQSRTEWLFLGCGTSCYLAEGAAASWSLLTGQRARALPASEPLLFPDAAFLRTSNLQAAVISRSGRTSEALRAANLLSRDNRIPPRALTAAPRPPLPRFAICTVPLPPPHERATSRAPR